MRITATSLALDILELWVILRQMHKHSEIGKWTMSNLMVCNTLDSFGSGLQCQFGVSFPGCYSLPTDMDKGYPEFGYYLNRTGRPMIYSCSWPVYQTYSKMTVT